VSKWKLVPVEPTVAMVNAGTWMEYGESSCAMQRADEDSVREVWAAMLAAAPAAPSAESEAVAVDIERLIADCVPGGDWCDPQAVADAIRAWNGWHSSKETE